MSNITTFGKNFGKQFGNYITDAIDGAKKVFTETMEEKAKRISDYRRQASRMASVANKRIERLEANDLTGSPAYQGYLRAGGQRFGVKGKSFNEVQAEVARMRKLIDANTSTVRGINDYLKDMAVNTGITYNSLKELRAKSDTFFTLASKVEQYLRQVDDIATAIGYQKIWESINEYVADNKVDLASSTLSVDEMVERVTDAIREHEKPEYIDFDKVAKGWGGQWFTLEE